MIHATAGHLHWNYFVALERDLEVVSRYVEFTPDNFATYSIEFAHLLFAAASEVDVVAKLLCHKIQPTATPENINEYRTILSTTIPSIATEKVFISRYGLTLMPWDEWTETNNPIWWRSYNKVKHERDAHFKEATLKNALSALGGLLIFVFHYYSYSLAPAGTVRLLPKDTTQALQPSSILLRLDETYYYGHLIV